jgi:hypothetical protein
VDIYDVSEFIGSSLSEPLNFILFLLTHGEMVVCWLRLIIVGFRGRSGGGEGEQLGGVKVGWGCGLSARTWGVGGVGVGE